ncbi:MAG TPA: hypothetical protein VNB49_11740, partial [Candidatus Dormibacteraeota bacterium]|nr:hypothetical protein [Candidatus Dormibacteraeota bacterium]
HITNDPCEKDALSHLPGGGTSLSEIIGQSTRAARFSNTHIIRERSLRGLSFWFFFGARPDEDFVESRG